MGGYVGSVNACHEHEELGEHSGKGWYAAQREECQRHQEAQTGICLIESVIVVYICLAAIVLLNNRYNAEYGHVGHHIYQDVKKI